MTLAVIGRVAETSPIENADRIQHAVAVCGKAGKWSGVVPKDLAAGSKVLVLLPDALVPESPRWEFLGRHKWRVRMARFKGVPSECVILPVEGAEADLDIGHDCGPTLGVTKYEKPLAPGIAGDAVGSFPSAIPKTDETNFQALEDREALMTGSDWVATLKYDGSSGTAWVDADGLHVCSRNLELKEFTAGGRGNVYWRAARKYGLDRLPPGLALQFEVCGPGIQGNPCGCEDVEIAAFTLYDMDARRRAHYGRLLHLCQALDLPIAKLVGAGHGPVPVDDLRAMAERATYANGKPAEGVVVRDINSRWSFKVISLGYKD